MPRQSRSKGLEDKALDKRIGTRVKVALVSGVCLKGVLLRYDAKTLVLEDEQNPGEETTVTRSHITATNAAEKRSKT